MEPLLCAIDVKKFLKISLPHVYKMADRGEIACIRIPQKGRGSKERFTLRFRKTDLIKFIDNHYQAMNHR